ncbi:uncharacterized protein DFL_005939 [Arthrobotrys flagrans]|uniref:Uncharacterized protein n=1 Tax=Arthrobotrys flagrans TaxID=97331 RepID=A0A436ZZI3_ARTFL|nr:hypothetical protein DFL_005939 [Arthrobotrys flagrans]
MPSSLPTPQAVPAPPVAPLYILDDSLRTRFRLAKLEGEAICTELLFIERQIDGLLKFIDDMKLEYGEGGCSGEMSKAFWELKRMEMEVKEKTGGMGRIMEGMDVLETELDLWLRYQSSFRNYQPR